MSIRRRARPPLALLPLLALGLGACSDTTDPGDPLPFNEMEFYGATVDRLALFGAADAAHANLRLALDWPRGAIDAETFGSHLVYESGTGWTAEDDPNVPPNVIRVTWYDIFQANVDPGSERGYIDLTDLGGTADAHVRVGIHHGLVGQVADYSLRATTGETAAAQTTSLEVDGFFGDGVNQVGLTMTETETRDLSNGTVNYVFNAHLSDSGFSWQGVVEEDSTTADVLQVRFSGETTLQSGTATVELDLQDHPTSGLAGSGQVFWGGAHFADIGISGNQLVFSRAGGGSFTSTQQSRLGTLVNVVLTPALVIQDHFSE